MSDSSVTESRARHTAGPWKWFNYPDGRKLLTGADKAVIHCPDAPMTCDPSDADLIAAAPDLLAAVLFALDEDNDWYDVKQMLLAVRAKAEGRS